MSRIIFVACAYNRPQILKLSLLGLERLKKVAYFQTLIACSDLESVAVCEEFGVDYFIYDNLPIGRKNNELFERALTYDIDYIIQFSDDDVMSTKLFKEYLSIIPDNPNYVRPQRLYFYDLKTKRAVEFNPENTFGAFRMFSRRAVESVGWTYAVTFRQDVNQYKQAKTYEIKKRLFDYFNKIGVIAKQYERFEIWQPELNHALDFSSETRFIENGFTPMVIDLGKPHVIDFKSEQNIWKFEKYWTQGKDVTQQQVFDILGEEEIKHLKTI